MIGQTSIQQISGLSATQCEGVAKLSRLQAFKDISKTITNNPDASAWLETITPEHCVPCLWQGDEKLTPIGRSIHELLAIQALRPDRLTIFLTFS